MKTIWPLVACLDDHKMHSTILELEMILLPLSGLLSGSLCNFLSLDPNERRRATFIIYIYSRFNYRVLANGTVSQTHKEPADMRLRDLCLRLIGNKWDHLGQYAKSYETQIKVAAQRLLRRKDYWFLSSWIHHWLLLIVTYFLGLHSWLMVHVAKPKWEFTNIWHDNIYIQLQAIEGVRTSGDYWMVTASDAFKYI